VFEITANRIGVERGLKFTGASQITAPGGIVLHRATKTKEEALAVDIDPGLALQKSINSYNDLSRIGFLVLMSFVVLLEYCDKERENIESTANRG